MDTEPIQSSGLKITNRMIDALGSTRPWAMFLSIVGFIFVGLMVLAGMTIMVVSAVMPRELKGIPGIVMGIIYIFMSFFYLVPSIYLFKYASALGRFLDNMLEFEIESALFHQKSFWKFVGIVTIIMFIVPS
jgi:hypothetical protein